MKKVLLLITILVLTLISAACTSNKKASSADIQNPIEEKQQTEEPNQEDKNNSTEFSYGGNYIDDNLKGDYSISYKITSSETNQEDSGFEVKMMRTNAGYYVSMDENTEMLYIKNGDKYDMYLGDSENGFEPYAGVSLTEEEVKAQAQMFLSYMSAYAEFKDSLIRKGSQTIAGRGCETYSYDYNMFGVSLKYEYCIDKETGVCMKFYIEGASQGESGAYQFECTDFKTSGVTLPKYN